MHIQYGEGNAFHAHIIYLVGCFPNDPRVALYNLLFQKKHISYSLNIRNYYWHLESLEFSGWQLGGGPLLQSSTREAYVRYYLKHEGVGGGGGGGGVTPLMWSAPKDPDAEGPSYFPGWEIGGALLFCS